MTFDYAACKQALRESTYERCNRLASEAKCRKAQEARQRGDWWMRVDWLDWLDEPGAESRPTERIAMILISKEYRRTIEQLDRWWVINTLRFAYDQSHELPLNAILLRRGAKLNFIEVGYQGSGKLKSVEVALDVAA